MNKRTVSLQIAGKEYRVRSDADESWLQHVAECVDETMGQIRDRTGMVDTYDIAMLACLNLAREVITHRDARSSSATVVEEEQLKRLIDSAEAALDLLPAPLRESLYSGAGPDSHLLSLGDLSREDAAQGILGPLTEGA